MFDVTVETIILNPNAQFQETNWGCKARRMRKKQHKKKEIAQNIA
jgi:hypothetical protein